MKQGRLAKELPLWYYEAGWIGAKYRTHGWKATLMVINAVGHLAEAAWAPTNITASYAGSRYPPESRRQGHHRQGFRAGAQIEDVVQWRPGVGSALEGNAE